MINEIKCRITYMSLIAALMFLFLILSSNMQAQESLPCFQYEKWNITCLNKIDELQQTDKYTDWQLTNARLLMKGIDSTIFNRLYQMVDTVWTVEKDRPELYVLFYFIDGEVFSMFIQFVAVHKEQCIVAQCKLETGEVTYSDTKSFSIETWNKLLQSSPSVEQSLSNRFFIISSISDKDVSCKVIDVGFNKVQMLSKWFFSESLE